MDLRALPFRFALAFVLVVQLCGVACGSDDPRVAVSVENPTPSWKRVVPYPSASIVVVELSGALPAQERESLIADLESIGFQLLSVRPSGFPNPGSPQTMDQTLLALRPPAGLDFDACLDRIRSRPRLTRDRGYLGMLPAYRHPSDTVNTYFRPAHITLLVNPHVPYYDIGRKLAEYPWLVRADREEQVSVLTEYTLKRVILAITNGMDVFQAIDSLQPADWIAWISPIRLDWKANLPYADVPGAIDKLAIGHLSKFRTRDLIQVAHAQRTDGPAVAEIVARAQYAIDSNLCFRVHIAVTDPADQAMVQIRSIGVQIVDEAKPSVSGTGGTRIVADVAYTALLKLVELPQVLSVESQPRSILNNNFEGRSPALEESPQPSGGQEGPASKPKGTPQSAAPCWPNGACTPACQSQGVSLAGVSEWHAAGRNGAGIRIGIIDQFDRSSFDTAVFNCGLSSAVLSPAFHYDSRVLNPHPTYTMAHGVEVAVAAVQMAPCADLYFAEPSSVDLASLLSDLRGIRAWLNSNSVQVVNISWNTDAEVQADGSDALAALVDSMAATDGMIVVVVAGNERRWHHERTYASHGNVRYPTSFSAPVFQPGFDVYHNVTQMDDDLSNYLLYHQGSPVCYLQWRNGQFTGAPTKWWFEMVFAEGPNDDAVNFLSGDAVAMSVRNLPYDTPDPLNGVGLDAWVGHPIPTAAFWSNWNAIGLSAAQTLQSPGGFYHLMISNGVHKYCETPLYQSLYPMTCGSDSFFMAEDYVLELAVDLPTPLGWSGFLEPNPNRSSAEYNDTIEGTLMLSPSTASHVICVGGFNAQNSARTRVDYSSSGPICSVFTAPAEPDRPHVLGPTAVRLPLSWGGFGWCGLAVNGTSKGDEDCSGYIASSDIIYLVNYVFKGGPAPCAYWDNADVNCNNSYNSADILYLTNFVLKGGPPPILCL